MGLERGHLHMGPQRTAWPKVWSESKDPCPLATRARAGAPGDCWQQVHALSEGPSSTQVTPTKRGLRTATRLRGGRVVAHGGGSQRAGASGLDPWVLGASCWDRLAGATGACWGQAGHGLNQRPPGQTWKGARWSFQKCKLYPGHQQAPRPDGTGGPAAGRAACAADTAEQSPEGPCTALGSTRSRAPALEARGRKTGRPRAEATADPWVKRAFRADPQGLLPAGPCPRLRLRQRTFWDRRGAGSAARRSPGSRQEPPQPRRTGRTTS